GLEPQTEMAQQTSEGGVGQQFSKTSLFKSETKDISTPYLKLEMPFSPERLFMDLDAIERMEPQEKIGEIERLFAGLPIPVKYPDDPNWSKVKDIDLFMLSKTLNTYIKLSTKNGSLNRPEQFNTVMQMLAIGHQLCWRFDADNCEGFLQDLSLGLDYF